MNINFSFNFNPLMGFHCIGQSSQGAFNLSKELATNSSKKVKKLDENSAQFILQGVLDFYHKKNLI